MAAGRGEPPGPRVGKGVAEDLEHRGRVRHVDQRWELAVDGKQRNRHGERFQHRNRRRERRQLGATPHGAGQWSQAGLQIAAGRPRIGEEVRDGERRGDRAAASVASLDPVSHDAALARCIHGLRSLAALDDDSAPVLEESGMEVPAHDPFVEGVFQARQLGP